MFIIISKRYGEMQMMSQGSTAMIRRLGLWAASQKVRLSPIEICLDLA